MKNVVVSIFSIAVLKCSSASSVSCRNSSRFNLTSRIEISIFLGNWVDQTIRESMTFLCLCSRLNFSLKILS